MQKAYLCFYGAGQGFLSYSFKDDLMNTRIRALFHGAFNVEPQERLKLLFLAISFFFVIAGYTIARDLKDAVFLNVVGREWVPIAKFIAMVVLIPAILFYSFLVDRVRRYQLLTIYTGFYGFMLLAIAYFIGHPTIGMMNTHASPSRLFGWLVYFLIEGYSPFVVGTFWAFANSINNPESAKKNYGLMVSASKLGGAISAGSAWWFFTRCAASNSFISDVFAHQVAFFVAALFVLCVPVAIFFLMKKVPSRYLHGYEAAYQVEKERTKGGKKAGIFEGLTLLFKYPYVMGIFGMVYFYEVVAAVLSYLRLGVAEEYINISAKTAFLFQVYFISHLIGLCIALLGTRTLLSWLGTRACLLLIPLLSGGLLFYAMVSGDSVAIVFAFIALKAVNYAFSYPVRESLYIPTVKDIKFKSKSWIDAFGSKVARASGSVANLTMPGITSPLFLAAHSFFFAGVVGLWFVTALFLGKRFERAVKNDEVIGA
jgi:AAA family ATP:ADP antiporter